MRYIVLAAILCVGCSQKTAPVSTPDAASGPPAFEHRAQAVACSGAPRPPISPGAPSGAAHDQCLTDGDCADAGFNGRCQPSASNPQIGFCVFDECLSDSDCVARNVTPPCRCDDDAGPVLVNRCTPRSTCATDVQCGQNGFCSPSFEETRCAGRSTQSLDGYYCRTLDESCASDADCDGGTCSWNPETGHWACRAIFGCSG